MPEPMAASAQAPTDHCNSRAGVCADDMVGCLLCALVLHRHLSEAIKGVTVHAAAYGDRMIVCRPAGEA